MNLLEAAQGVLAPLGYEVLEVTVNARGRERRVLVRIDRLDEGRVAVDDVRKASEAFGLELDRLDPFEGRYHLEVESPGAQRPLLRARHFERFHDLLVKVRVAGKALSGRVRAVEGDTILFELEGDGGVQRLSVGDIERAQLAEWPSEPR
jgi:ribosome maturation factor RimP